MFAKSQSIGDGAIVNRKSKNTLNPNLAFSNKDFNSLSSWYCKIDEKFAKAVRALELYYGRVYEMKIGKICGEIKQLMQNIDQNDEVRHTEQFKNTLAKRDLQTYFTNYKASTLAFRNLAREIERSNYCELLQVYLKTKNYELVQQAIQFKVHQLEGCQQRMTEVISNEVNALNTLKKNTVMLESTSMTMKLMENKVETAV